VSRERPLPPPIIQADAQALELFEKTLDALESMGVLAYEDAALIEAYAINYSLLLNTVAEIQKHGDTTVTDQGIKANGLGVNFIKYLKEHRAMMASLGLTPSGRASIAGIMPANKKGDSAVADLLSKLASGSK
jgi:P27 family predicted phage terminase small subunit